jgi:hypothetical protein
MDHQPGRVLGAEEGPRQVHVDHGPPPVGLRVHDRRDQEPDARVVDQDVQSPEARRGLPQRAFDLPLVAHVERQGHRLASRRTQPGSHRLHLVDRADVVTRQLAGRSSQVRDHDTGAGLGKAPADRLAEPAPSSRTGYQCDLAVEPVHRAFPCWPALVNARAA